MLRTGDIVSRPDFRLGDVIVSPSRRRIEGPAGQASLEPRTMQVLLLLLDAEGRVVTRNELFDECWGGAMVGDDALNRAIGKVRKIADDVAPGAFSVETIPRTGYRLTLQDGISHPTADSTAAVATVGDTPAYSRRSFAVGGLAAAGLAAGGLGLWTYRSIQDRRFQELIDRGMRALDYGDPYRAAVPFFERAAALRSDDPEALGLYAYSQVLLTEGFEPSGGDTAVQGAERAARAALELDAGEPNALLTRILLQRGTLDFAQSEDRLRAVVASDPANIQAMRHLWNMLQCVGRSREALQLVDRALALKPFAASCTFPRAQLLWITGRVSEADRVIHRAMENWPDHRNVRFARFILLAFTGRPAAALAMLESAKTTPQNFSPDSVALWRGNLAALDQPSPSAVTSAKQECIEASERNPRLASQAVMTMVELGELDVAFDIAAAHFAVLRSTSGPQDGKGSSTAWRFAPWLFTPPVAPLIADPRFRNLADEIGLTSYWALRGVRPDYPLADA